MAGTDPVCEFVRAPSSKGKNIRKRARQDEDGVAPQRVGPAPPDPTELSQETGGQDDLEPLPTKREQEDVQKDRERIGQSYSSSHSAIPAGPEDMGATLTSSVDAPKEEGAPGAGVIAAAQGKAGVYKGLAGYSDYLEHKPQSGLAKGTGIKAGPVKMNSSIRVTCRFDYQPDVCKDFKETGYCGWGDSCKFLHDRGDYKSGWQMEQEWDEEQAAKARSAIGLPPAPAGRKNRFKYGEHKGWNGEPEDGAAPAADEEPPVEAGEMPFACLKCRAKWDMRAHKPVVTKCGHFFCEACLVSAFRTSTRCPYCKESTGGTFTQPRDIVSRIERMRELAEQVPDDTTAVDSRTGIKPTVN